MFNCPSCKHMLSFSALSCPNCGERHFSRHVGEHKRLKDCWACDGTGNQQKGIFRRITCGTCHGEKQITQSRLVFRDVLGECYYEEYEDGGTRKISLTASEVQRLVDKGDVKF